MRNSCLEQAPEKSKAGSGGAGSANTVLAAEGVSGAVGVALVELSTCPFSPVDFCDLLYHIYPNKQHCDVIMKPFPFN